MAQLKRRPSGPSEVDGIDNRFYAWRPASHLQGRPVRSHGGNVLVQQVRRVRGHSHRSSKDVRETLEPLGLRGIDAACIVSESDSSAFGRIQNAQSYLSIERLNTTVPPGNYRMWIFKDGTLMYREDYGAHVSPAELVVIGEGEYLQAETSGEFLSVTWSSGDDAAAAVRKALDVLGDPVAGDEPAFVQLDSEKGDGESGGGTVSDVLEYLEGAKPPLAFVRVTFPEYEFVWGPPVQRLWTSETAYAEIGLRVRLGAARHTIDALITQTGTDQLKARHLDVEGQIRQLVA